MRDETTVFAGQASDKPRGRKPRDASPQPARGWTAMGIWLLAVEP